MQKNSDTYMIKSFKLTLVGFVKKLRIYPIANITDHCDPPKIERI